jgi:hypothetical protein
MSTSVTDRIAAFEAKAAAEFPAAAMAVFGAERQQQGAKTPTAPAVGTPMPDGALLDAHGAATSLTAARAGPPSWCSTGAPGARTATWCCAPTRKTCCPN